MAHRDTRQGKSDVIKKDRQAVQRDLRDEIAAEAANETVAATHRKHNRDAARGDWDRGHPRADSGLSREPELPEAAGEESGPESWRVTGQEQEDEEGA
jgi:hypothetical protein